MILALPSDQDAMHRRSRGIVAVQGPARSGIEPVPSAWQGGRGAGVAELVDAPDLGSGGANRGGSSPSARTSLRRADG